MPILTRIYSPVDYGVLSIFTALVTMLVPIVTMRYGVAVPLPRRDGTAMNIMALAAALMLAMTLIVGAVLWAFGSVLLAALSMEALIPYWWLILLGVVGAASYELLSFWATRRKAYPTIARTQVAQAATGALVKIGLGMVALKPLGLLLGQIMGHSGGIGSFLIRFKMDFCQTVTMISLRRMATVGRYYSGFPVYRLPSQVLLVFSAQAPVLLTAALYDAGTVGQLGVALAAVAVPLNLFTTTIGRAYYAEVANIGRNNLELIRKITFAILGRLSLVAIVPAAMLMIYGKDILMFVLGDDWALAGQFASSLAISLFPQFLTSPVMQVLSVIGEERRFLLFNLQRTVITIAPFLLADLFAWSSTTTILAYSFFIAAHRFSNLVFLIRILNR
ncbi:lipopolysaccharide biosynthesis protein [Thiorhodococcus minor]|uniref:Oligosaccharide flippase family protein n=1 Tax=Thiorhodococcus minor TaxID=57489 RepID=A0A6M0K7Y8_9GAMM|nr:oligosaccharide flippase family protein [Thiorhodococcus minor]NEV65083.1 oligosaccharide flippase family protein [Thiorhodococcus minor]